MEGAVGGRVGVTGIGLEVGLAVSVQAAAPRRAMARMETISILILSFLLSLLGFTLCKLGPRGVYFLCGRVGVAFS